MKRMMLIWIGLILILASCAPAMPSATPTSLPPSATPPPPTATAVPATPTALPPTLTPKPTALPPLTAKPIAQPAAAITSANVSALTELARWGFGRAEQIAWSADGAWFTIQTPLGALVQKREGEAVKVNQFLQGSAYISPASGYLAMVHGVEKEHLTSVYALMGEGGLSLLFTMNASRPVFSADDARLALTGPDGVLVLETRTGKLLHTYDHKNADHLIFSKDGALLFSGARDSLMIWKVGESAAVKRIEFNRLVRFVISEDGQLLLVQNRSKQNVPVVDIWSVKEWKQLGSIKTAGSFILTPDAARVYVSSNFPTPGSIEVYQLPEGTPQPGFRANGSIYRLSISPDGKTLAVSIPDVELGVVHLYDTATQKLRVSLDCTHSCDAQVPTFSPNGKVLALYGHAPMAGVDAGAVALYDAATGRNLGRLMGNTALKNNVERILFSADSTQLAVLTGASDETVRFWNVAGAKMLSSLAWASQISHLGAISADGKLIATYNGTPSTYLTLMADGSRVTDIPKAAITQFSADGKLAAGVAFLNGKPDVIRLWRVPGGEPAAAFSKMLLPPLTLSPAGDVGAVISGFSVQLLRIPTGQFVSAYTATARPNVRLKLAQFSPDGKLLVAGDENGLVWGWNVESRKQLFIMEGHSKEVSAFTFSPDNQVIISLGQDGGVRLWKAADGKLQRAINAQELIVKQAGMDETTFGLAAGIALSPDGKLLAISGTLNPQQAAPHKAGVTLLIDAETGALLRLLRGGGGRVFFSPDGKMLFTGGDGAVRLWGVLP